MLRVIVLIACLFLAGAKADAQSPAHVLYGVDFSPYLTGQNPNLGSQVTTAQITDRIQLIAPYTQWIRSFSTTHGLENIPPVARQYGLKVAANAWIGNNTAQNNLEIQALIAAANAGQIDIAIVGSEALLRNDLSESQLIAYMNQVRQAIPPSIPVTTADTYRTLLDHPSVIAASDVVFANFYPYWEGISVTNAVCAIDKQYRQLVAAAGGKPVIVSETGWPSAGNAIGAAIPSMANAALFFLQFVTWATSSKVPYFYFEAFNEDWKSAYEGPQGAHWGIWDSAGGMKPGMDAVFAGQTAPLACDGTIDGPGTPALSFVFVPPYGFDLPLQGRVSHVSPASYGVAVYIKVAGGWWTKPTFAQPVTLILGDGTWSGDVVTGGSDAQATEIAAFLIPSNFTPPQMAGGGTLPDTLFSASVDHLQIQRTPNSISGTVLDSAAHPLAGVAIADPNLGTASTAPDGRYSFYNLPASGNVTLTPAYPNFVFTPPAASLVITSGNQTANFIASANSDLAMAGTLSPGSVQQGSGFTAAIVVSNAGIAAAAGASATITFPAATSILSFSTTRGVCSVANHQVMCSVGGLAPAASATITIQAAANIAGLFSVAASVTGPDSDADPSNNSISIPLTIQAVFSISGNAGIAGAHLALTGSFAASATSAGNGDYSFASLAAGGTYTVTPSLPNYSFEPPSITFANLHSNEILNFTAKLSSIQSVALAVAPASGAGSQQAFQASYSHTQGYGQFLWVQFLIAAAQNGGGQPFCFVHYDVRGNGFWLYSDLEGFFRGPIAPGLASIALQGSSCALNTAASSAAGLGSTLSLNLALVFKTASDRNIYMRAMDISEADTRWLQRGTWTQSSAPLPNLSVSPLNGTAAAASFVLTFPDPPGFGGTSLGWVQFLVAAAADGGGQPFCFAHYDRAGNGLWMYSSDFGFFLGPISPGVSSGMLTSSACTLNPAATTVQSSAQQLVVTLPVTFKAPMKGARTTYLRMFDPLSRDTGWQAAGLWTVP